VRVQTWWTFNSTSDKSFGEKHRPAASRNRGRFRPCADPPREERATASSTVQGRRIRTLIDGDLPAGQQVVLWDGRTDAGFQVPSGIYFVRLAGTKHLRTQRLMVVR
jgi:hypothetical protein